VQSILSNKPLSGSDINSLAAAKKEMQRIRKLMDNYKQQSSSSNKEAQALKELSDAAATPGGGKHRAALHEEEHINDYVKTNVKKEKDVRVLIYEAIKKNVLFESNTEDELHEIIDVFEPCTYEPNEVVIKQKDRGDYFYVVESGDLAITVHMALDGKDVDNMDSTVNVVKVGNYQEGSAFGELALIYGSPRAATITSTSRCKLWRIKRFWYRGVVGQHRKKLHMEKLKFLPNVKVGKREFKDVFENDQLDTMAQLLKQEYFHKGDTIVREGEAGNTFYLIQDGEVDIYRKGLGEKDKSGNSLPIATLGKEKFFGEKALISDDVRKATVVAASAKVVCYVMTRSDFNRMLGSFQDILDGGGKARRTTVFAGTDVAKKERVTVKGLDDLDVKLVLGEGGFGKVKLVKSKKTGESYALKSQGKKFIIDNGQKDYILRELELMNAVKHPNILMLHCAFQDPSYIYFLLDLLPGGELMTILESKKKLPEKWVQFYSASVILAYTEFHRNRIAYRDLKPENMVLDAQGYCVIVDLGLAKKLDNGPTYTFCGTPDYIAPELILGTGYNWAVDYWALGVLLVRIQCLLFLLYTPTRI
jgi:CRP-like cAMP-binding protein